MESKFLFMLSPLEGLLINTVIQILVCRLTRNMSLLLTAFIGLLAGAAAMIATEFFIQNPFVPQEDFGYLVTLNLLIYLALSFCYLNVIMLGETGRRIRLLHEFLDAKEGLSMDNLLKQYNAREIIERRLERLRKTGQIIVKENHYYIGKPAVALISSFFLLMKKILYK